MDFMPLVEAMPGLRKELFVLWRVLCVLIKINLAFIFHKPIIPESFHNIPEIYRIILLKNIITQSHT